MDQADSLNYFLGLNFGYDVKSAPFDVNPQLISAGLMEAYADSSRYNRQISQTIMRQLQMALAQKESEKVNKVSMENLKKGAAFLAENGKREGVVTTESGLQYEVIVKGEGAMPTDTSKVTVNYEGSLIDGTVFDSSFERGESVSFPLSGVIRGWIEGLQLMPAGSTYRFFIPAELGYGPRDQGPIPANSVLIFKVELISFE
jgi:FKBP-type peptidyl-prolyl cis-trans isomerase